MVRSEKSTQPMEAPPLNQGQPPPYAPPFPGEAAPQPPPVMIAPGSSLPMGPDPVITMCPSCHAQISTNIKFEPNSKTHMFAILLCLLGGICCAPIPYCTPSCQDTNHYCPNCNAFLGTYSS